MGVKLLSSSGGSVEIAAPVTASNYVLTAPAKSGTLDIAGPVFSAYASTSPSVSNVTFTKIILDTVEYDTSSCFNTTLNRFIPNIAGYYQINAVIAYTAPLSATGIRGIHIYKNGSVYKRGTAVPGSSTNWVDVAVSCVVYCNGTTDFIEAYAEQSSGSNATYLATSYGTSMDGALIRSA